MKKILVLTYILILFLVLPNVWAQQQNNDEVLITPKSVTDENQLVELNFQNIEIRLLLDIVSQFSGKSFLFREQDLQNRRITLISPEKYTIQSAYQIFEKILSVNDLRLIQEDNNIIRVVNVNEARNILTKEGIRGNLEFEDDTVVVRVVPVKNTNINTVFRAINPFLSKTGIITRFDDINAFIIKDNLENAERLADLIRVFDTKNDYKIKNYFLKYISVAQLKPILERIITKENTTSRSQFFSYDNEKNSIFVFARQNEINSLENLIKRLDVSVESAQKDDFQLKYIAVQHLKVTDAINLLQKIFGSPPKKEGTIIEGSLVVSFEDTNSFVAYGPIASITRIEQFLKEIDKEAENIVLEVMPILYTDAEFASNLITKVFEGRVTAASPLKLKTFVEKNSNSLILIGTAKTINKVRQFITLFDKPRVSNNTTEFRFYFYPVENASAVNIASIIGGLLGNIIQQAKTQGNSQDKNNQNTTTTTQQQPASTPQSTPQNQQGQTQQAGQNQPTSAPIPSVISVSNEEQEQQPAIIADEETNSLIIYATAPQYKIISAAIEDLDVIRPQVYVEALIVEVSVNRGLNLGVNYRGAGVIGNENAPEGAFSFNTPGGSIPVGGLIGSSEVEVATNLLSSNPDAVVGAFGNTFVYGGRTFAGQAAFIQALAQDTEIEILSNPKIITLNNKKAVINVGENRAFQTGTVTDSAGNSTNNYDYRDIGVKLEILPQIKAGDYITMEITQENTNVAGNTNTERPTTLKRAITTEVNIKSGDSVALGGLINENKTNTDSKVPCLGDIPLLGYLFKNQSTSVQKTNLVVFITPTIIRTPEDQAKANKKAVEQIKTPIKDIGKRIQIQLDDIINTNSGNEK